MNKSAIALIALVFATLNAAALAQDAPMRGFGLLALNTDDSHSGLDNPAHSTIEAPDSGGGSGARALRGGDGATPHAGLPADGTDTPKADVPFDDPAQPVAPTPKRPSYRWQSLVPGAIK